MLVYKGMDIGTAKPTEAERGEVPHHLIDLVAPQEEFSVAAYLEKSKQVEADLRQRDRHALYVGGTGLYLKALTAGFLQSEGIPPAVRSELQREMEAGERLKLWQELAGVDPVLHARLHPNDDKRMLRGLEFHRTHGKPLSDDQRQWQEPAILGAPAVALDWERATLRERIAKRFDEMLAEGLMDEVCNIHASDGFGKTSAKALGYRQLLSHLNGECSLTEAREQAITKTRVLIRRQMSWLRSFEDLRWLPLTGTEPVQQLVRQALRLYASSENN